MEMVVALVGIMVVNLILSGDNAVVIAMACRYLPPKHQKPAILLGTSGAVVLRVLLTFIAAWILTIPYLQSMGGLLLVWIAVKLLIDDAGCDSVKECTSYFRILACTFIHGKMVAAKSLSLQYRKR